MSQKEAIKKQEPLIEEDKDFYLSFLNKKIRNTKKKLEQIDELLKKDPETLKPEQLEKIHSRDEVLGTVKHHEDLKKLYYTAYKSALEEGKETSKPKSIEKAAKKSVEDKQVTSDNALEGAMRKLLELFAVSQLLNDSTSKNVIRSAIQDTNSVTQLQQLCNSVLNFTSRSSSCTVEERVQQSLQNIQPYIKSEGEFELEGQKYSNLQQTIQQTIQQFDANSAKVEEMNSNKSPEVSLPPSAAILQSSLMTSNSPPQKLPKVVRFVDEVEKDLINENKEITVNEPSSSAPETESNAISRPVEEEREQSGEEQEQKSFRKKRNYESQEKPKNKPTRNYRKNNYEQDNYHRGGRNSNSKYQYYYEKKSAE